VRVVLDANIVASALIRPAGPPGRILGLLFGEGAFELVLSPAIVDELRRVLRYPRVRKRLTLSEVELDGFLLGLELLAVPVAGESTLAVVRADPDDDKYLAAAVEGLAEVVVSGDDHLLALERYEGYVILNARAFLRLLGKG
jgi:hypothetical protein